MECKNTPAPPPVTINQLIYALPPVYASRLPREQPFFTCRGLSSLICQDKAEILHTLYDGRLESESSVKEKTLMALSWKCEGEEGGVHVQPHTLHLAHFLSTDWADETDG